MISLILNLRPARALLPALLLGCLLYAPQARAQTVESTQQSAPPAVQDEQLPPRPGERDQRLLPLLNLSPEQRAQLLAIAQEHQLEQRAAQLRLRAARRALNQAIYAEQPDQNIVNERAHELAAANEALIRLNAQAQLKVRQVLTPEQLRKFHQLKRESQRRLRPQMDDLPRRQRRDRFPNGNRPPNAQPDAPITSPTPVQPRPRPLRRQRP